MEERSYLDTDMCYVVYCSHAMHGPIKEGIGYWHNPIALVKYGKMAWHIAKTAAREYGTSTIRDAWGNHAVSFRLEGKRVVEVPETFDGETPSWRNIEEENKRLGITN